MRKLLTCTGDYTLVDADIYELFQGDHWHFDGTSVFKGVGKGRSHSLHTLILGSSPTGYVIDHKDNNPLNNQRSNLRFATYQQNSFNCKKMSTRPTTSEYKGVHRRKNGKWRAVIQHNGKKINIGTFKSESEAALSYNKLAKELFGEFAYLNQVEGETHA
jgi:hypothetical protein